MAGERQGSSGKLLVERIKRRRRGRMYVGAAGGTAG